MAVAVVGALGHPIRADVAGVPGAPAADAPVAKVVVGAPDLRLQEKGERQGKSQ